MIDRDLSLIFKLYVGHCVLLIVAVGSDMKHMKAANGYEFIAISMSVAESLALAVMGLLGLF